MNLLSRISGVVYIISCSFSSIFGNRDLQFCVFYVPDVVCLLRESLPVTLFLRTIGSTDGKHCSSVLNISYRIEKFILYFKTFVLDRINLQKKLINFTIFIFKKPVIYSNNLIQYFFPLKASNCNLIFLSH